MLTKEKIDYYNNILLNKLSVYLNNYSDYISKEMVDNLVKSTDLTISEAFKLLLFSTLGFDMKKDKELYNYYFHDMIKLLDIKKYQDNAYYKNILITNIKEKNWCFVEKTYKSYQAFVYNDLKQLVDGRIIPQIGFFETTYNYPSIEENSREWMLITPNEIETMDKPINASKGNVLTLGLGLGYYAYMASLKSEVKSITIIENNQEVINLFKKYILPQFKYKAKIKVVCDDAFNYLINTKENYDFVFADIWHDPSDGIDLYLKLKNLEKDNVIYYYWIEDTIKCYLEE